jgi:hypothetical protein
MSLYKVLPAEPIVKGYATKAASLVGTRPFLETIAELPNLIKDTQVFRYRWVDEFKDLADAITRAQVCTSLSMTLQLLSE